MRTEGGLQPLEIGEACGFDAEDEELGGLVAVELVVACFEGGELVGAGFEQEKGFGGGLDLVFPAEDGLYGGQEGGAGGEVLFDESVAELRGFVGRGAGCEDDADREAGSGCGVGHDD